MYIKTHEQTPDGGTITLAIDVNDEEEVKKLHIAWGKFAGGFSLENMVAFVRHTGILLPGAVTHVELASNWGGYEFLLVLRYKRQQPTMPVIQTHSQTIGAPDIDPDDLPTLDGDEEMGINSASNQATPRRMKKHNYPPNIKDLDYTELTNSQMWVLADFVGCRHKLVALNGNNAAQREALKEGCNANLVRAQSGYDIIVLRKDPPKGGTLPEDQEAHYVELLCDILNKYSEGLEQASDNAIQKILDDIKGKLKDQESKLLDFAKRAIVEAAEKRAPFVIKEGTKIRKVKGVLPPCFKDMVELASERIPILLVGPAGCGKTYLGTKLAEALGLEYSDQSCSEGMSESVFNGRLLPIGKGGNFEHVPSPFMQRYEDGGVMLLDEIDAGDPNLFTYINKAVANSSYTVEQRHTSPVVKKHADFVLVAAANTFGNGADAMYVGRNQLDAATLDRFRVGTITMDYAREVEESLAPKAVLDWAWEIRAAIYTKKLRRVMSTRIIEQMAKMHTRFGWERPKWDAVYFADWTEAERKLLKA